MKNIILVVTGPTATGKSDLAEKIAEKIDGEIINADIGSWYTPLSIGTAKPDLSQAKVPHHLFNILDEPQQFTVVEFRSRVEKLAKEIWARGRIPVVTGGSAFYVKSLWYKTQDSGSASKVENEIMNSAKTNDELWNELFTIDPVRAKKINHNDRYRIVRALGIYKSTGKKPSEFEPIYEPIGSLYGIFCVRDRKDLYDRINKRTGSMLEAGWMQEVESLLGTEWENFLIDKKIIGYDDIITYFKGLKNQKTYEELVSVIQQKTRNYAKRQITFLSKLKKDIDAKELKNNHTSEIDLTLCDVGLYINGLSDQLFKTLD